MKKILASAKTAVILLIVTLISLGAYVYMLARPISYGMSYYNKSEYAGAEFEGTLEFYPDTTVKNHNTNFDEPMTFRYYYKDGYVFTLMATTDADYDEEVAYINENFDEAINVPFYASWINAFRYVNEGPDGEKAIYTCIPTVVIAIAGGIAELLLIGISGVSFYLAKCSGKKTEE